VSWSHVFSGSYRHRQCCFLCGAVSHTVEGESEGLVYTNFGRDAEYRQEHLGCNRAARMITYRGPWLHACDHDQADIDKRFHWLQWGHLFHDDSWFFSMEMLGYNLVRFKSSLSCLQLYNIYFRGIQITPNEESIQTCFISSIWRYIQTFMQVHFWCGRIARTSSMAAHVMKDYKRSTWSMFSGVVTTASYLQHAFPSNVCLDYKYV
jgi:hypothetical protein